MLVAVGRASGLFGDFFSSGGRVFGDVFPWDCGSETAVVV
jgi:hypothetical protein